LDRKVFITAKIQKRTTFSNSERRGNVEIRSNFSHGSGQNSSEKSWEVSGGRFKGGPSSDPEERMLFTKRFRGKIEEKPKNERAAHLSRNFSLVISTMERRWAREDVWGSNEGHRYLRRGKGKTFVQTS